MRRDSVGLGRHPYLGRCENPHHAVRKLDTQLGVFIAVVAHEQTGTVEKRSRWRRPLHQVDEAPDQDPALELAGIVRPRASMEPPRRRRWYPSHLFRQRFGLGHR